MFPPERDCQWASLSPAVWRGSLVETEGAREGAERRREKENKGSTGQWLRLSIRLESITHTALHFTLSHAIDPPQRP